VPWQSEGRDMEIAIRTAAEEAQAAAKNGDGPVVLWVGGSPHPRDRLLEAMKVAQRAGVDHLVIAGHQTLTASVAYESFRPQLRKAIVDVRSAEKQQR
jgi:uncharacterized radical SAM superfamily Fe-S cluster-containing enzyme